MKKIMCVAVLAALLVSNVSAASKSSKSAAPKEKNKIGGYVGWPIGVSYSRQISPLIQLDAVVGMDSYFLNARINANGTSWPVTSTGVGFFTRLSPLFRCWEGPLWPGAYGKVSVGPALGGFVGASYLYTTAFSATATDRKTVGGFSVSAPARFEVDFKFPLNIFAEVDIIGVQAAFSHVDDYSLKGATYYARGGVGARYRF